MPVSHSLTSLTAQPGYPLLCFLRFLLAVLTQVCLKEGREKKECMAILLQAGCSSELSSFPPLHLVPPCGRSLPALNRLAPLTRSHRANGGGEARRQKVGREERFQVDAATTEFKKDLQKGARKRTARKKDKAQTAAQEKGGNRSERSER